MAIKPVLREWLEDERSPKKRWLDVALAALIVVSVLSYVIYLSALLPEWADAYLHTFDLVVIGIFALEYVARLHVSSDFVGDLRRKGLAEAVGAKIRYMTRPMAIIDLVALLPAMRALRVARIFRLARLFRLVQHRSSFASIIDVFKEHAFELGTVFAVMMAALVFAGTAMFLIENPKDHPTTQFKTIGDAFWWAAITMATVGYGDIVPATGAGRVLAGFVVLSGVLVIAFPTAIITSAFTEKLARMKEGSLKMERFADHVVVCGLTKSTDAIVRKLEEEAARAGTVADLVVISSFAAPGVQAPGSAVLKRGDITRERTLREAGVEKASAVIVLAERRTVDTPDETVDARTLLAAMQVDAINPSCAIVVELIESENLKTLVSRVPRAEVIESGALAPRLMAIGTFLRGSAQVFTELLAQGEGNDFHDLRLSAGAVRSMPQFGSLFPALRKQGATPIAVRRGKEVVTNPNDEYPLVEGDHVLAIGVQRPTL